MAELTMTQPRRAARAMDEIVTSRVFRTELGWMGIQWCGTQVTHLVIGDSSKQGAWQRLGVTPHCSSLGRATAPEMEDVIARLQQYGQGIRDEFLDVEVSWQGRTAFQLAILRQCRAIPYGQVATYGQLAARAGYPRSARAVGNVMASNRVPLIVPCHRVVAANNRLGGFSAPTGVQLKRRLLALESGA